MGNVLLLLFPVRKDICFSFVLVLYSSYLQVELFVWGLGLALLGLHSTDVRKEMCLAFQPLVLLPSPWHFSFRFNHMPGCILLRFPLFGGKHINPTNQQVFSFSLWPAVHTLNHVFLPCSSDSYELGGGRHVTTPPSSSLPFSSCLLGSL